MIAGATAPLYCHGIPGSAAELDLFGNAIVANKLHVLDRVAASHRGSRWLDHLAEEALAVAGDRPIHLLGFSLGSHAALRLAALLGPRVSSIDLIAPAAPLETGDHLPLMAGGAIFRMARDHPRLFRAVAAGQSAMARGAPGTLAKMLLSSAVAADRSLADTREFQDRLGEILRTSLGTGKAAYRHEISAYVRPWADCLALVEAPVTLWHGEADNWSPPTMTDALAEHMPHIADVHRLAGLSHYSMLRTALPKIIGG